MKDSDLITLYRTRNHTWYDTRIIITHNNVIINIIVLLADGYMKGLNALLLFLGYM